MKKGLEDHDAWLSLAEHGWFGIMIPEAISLYRISQGSMSVAFSRDVTHQKHMHLFEALHMRGIKAYIANTKTKFTIYCKATAHPIYGTGLPQ